MNILIVGPYPPLKGGISDFNFKLFDHLKKYQSTFFIRFDRNYPFFIRSKKKQVLDVYNEKLNILKINPYNPFSYLKIIKFIKNKNIDKIISTYWTPIIGLPYLLINSVVSKKITKIGLFHNIFPHENYFLSKQILKLYTKTLNKAITLSEHTSKQLLEVSNLVSNSLFIPVDNLEKTSKTISLNKLDLNKNYKYILFMGMIRKYKGLELLLNAFKKVIEIEKNVKLIIAGEFIKNKKEYLSLINELSLTKNIVLNDNFIEPHNIKYYLIILKLLDVGLQYLRQTLNQL